MSLPHNYCKTRISIKSILDYTIIVTSKLNIINYGIYVYYNILFYDMMNYSVIYRL